DAGPLEEMPIETASMDAIAMWDVIEHLASPRHTLEAAHRWLRPGGVIAISTGDIGSSTARLHGRHWSLMTPPWHQYFFSRRTLAALLTSLGFTTVRVHGDGLFAVDRCTRVPRVPRTLGRILQHPITTAVGRRVGAGGITLVFARRSA